MSKFYICNYAGCSAIVPERGFCKLHADKVILNKPKSKPYANAVRYNGSLYNTVAWRSLRKQVIAEQRACQYCGVTTYLQVHHRIRPKGNSELFFNKSNLIVVCRTCHSRITALEQHQSGRIPPS